MAIEIDRIATIDVFKPPYDEWYVSVDLSTWLGNDTISSVAYTAKKDSDESDATADVIDAGSSTNTNTVLQPYIKGGEDGENYTVICKVTTANSDHGEFYIKFSCREEP